MGGKAWTLGYAIAKMAGLEEQYVWPREEQALAAFQARAARVRLGSWIQKLMR
jgi:hypothetical protein